MSAIVCVKEIILFLISLCNMMEKGNCLYYDGGASIINVLHELQ